MTIKSFIFDATRVVVRGGHEIGRQKTSRGPDRRCRSTHDPHSRGSWRHATVRAFGIPRLSPVQHLADTNTQCSSSRPHRWFFFPFLTRRDLRRRRRRRRGRGRGRRAFFCGTLLVCALAQEGSRPYRAIILRMIPIVGQIKIVLSAPHADRESFRGGSSFPKDRDEGAGCERGSSREQNRIPEERTCDYAPSRGPAVVSLHGGEGTWTGLFNKGLESLFTYVSLRAAFDGVRPFGQFPRDPPRAASTAAIFSANLRTCLALPNFARTHGATHVLRVAQKWYSVSTDNRAAFLSQSCCQAKTRRSAMRRIVN